MLKLNKIRPSVLSQAKRNIVSKVKFVSFLKYIYDNLEIGDYYIIDANEFNYPDDFIDTVRQLIKKDYGALWLSVYEDGKIKIFR